MISLDVFSMPKHTCMPMIPRYMRPLYPLLNYVPLDVLNTIYKSLIQPVFDYCDVVWDNLDQGLATEIQKLQNRAARIITYQGYDVRSEQIRKQLNWEELALRHQRHLSLLMYDTVNGNVPSYLSDHFSNVCENNPCKSMK